MDLNGASEDTRLLPEADKSAGSNMMGVRREYMTVGLLFYTVILIGCTMMFTTALLDTTYNQRLSRETCRPSVPGNSTSTGEEEGFNKQELKELQVVFKCVEDLDSESRLNSTTRRIGNSTKYDNAVQLRTMREVADLIYVPDGYTKTWLENANADEDFIVTFQDFILAMEERQKALEKVCSPYRVRKRPSVVEEVLDRGWILALLMVLQSVSGIILQRYEALLQERVVVAVFITMLVGAGGNAGTQSSTLILQDMARGNLDSHSWSDMHMILQREVGVAALLAVLMSLGAFIRVYISHGRPQPWYNLHQVSFEGILNCLSVGLSMACVVFISVILGAMLPFIMSAVGVASHTASPVVQVLMDICGVLIICAVASAVFGLVVKTKADKEKAQI